MREVIKNWLRRFLKFWKYFFKERLEIPPHQAKIELYAIESLNGIIQFFDPRDGIEEYIHFHELYNFIIM